VNTTLKKLETLAEEFEFLSDKGERSAPKMLALVKELQQEFEELSHQREELSSLYEIAQALASALDLSELLELIIDKALVLVGGERGFVVLADSPPDFQIRAARRFRSGEVEPTDESLSTTLVRRVMDTREPILTTNVKTDGRFAVSQSIILQDIRSVLAVPLIARGDLQGAIYVDTRMSIRHFDDDDLKLLQAMASQAALAIRAARLLEDLRQSNQQLQQTLDELQRAQDQLVQAERLAAVGRLAASVAHELRSPLMVMRNGIYYLQRLISAGKLDSPEILQRYLDKLDAEIDRQSKIINDLLFFSRNRPRRLTEVDVNAVIEESLMRVSMPESIQVERKLSRELPKIMADADQLQQVFVNLFTNAAQAMPSGGTLSVSSDLDEDENYVVIQVADTGVGIPPENLSRLFEPFFTTKDRGIGLGLSVTKSIVEGHRGRIQVQSEPGQGTTFTIWLPLELIA